MTLHLNSRKNVSVRFCRCDACVLHQFSSTSAWVRVLTCVRQIPYWRGPYYRKEFAVFLLFCNQRQEKHRKNTRRFKVNSSSIRQYTFCLEIQSINRENPAFFDPSFCCTFRSHRTLLSEAPKPKKLWNKSCQKSC